MKKLNLSALLVLLLFSLPAFAQKGFLGKRNHLSYDILNTFNQRVTGFNYTFTPKKNISWLFGYSRHHGNRNSDKPHYYNYDSTDASGDNVYVSGNIISTKISNSGYTWRAGMLWSSAVTNMPLPIGYYYGVVFSRTRRTISETAQAEETMDYEPVKNVSIPFEYKLKGTGFGVLFGRTSVLYKSLTLDANIEFGFARGNGDGVDRRSKSKEPAQITSRTLFFSKGSDSYYTGNQEGSHNLRYLRIYAIPHVSVGFMF